MYTDIYDSEPEPWRFKPPTKCDTNSKTKLFSYKAPYNGPRLNKAVLTMPYKPDHIHSKGLADLQTPIPTNFSWRKKGGDRIEKGGLRDQGGCGDCWSFSVASVLGDRYSIKYNIKSPYPSTSWLTSNAKPPGVQSNQECLIGGNTMLASNWLEQPNNGIKLEECWPYSIIRDNDFVSPEPLNKIQDDCCFNCCGEKVENINKILFSCKPGSSKYLVVMNNDNTINVQGTINAIKRDIMINGPASTSFYVYKDFMTYWIKDAPSGKIYIRNSNVSDGGHAVVITGWGTQKDDNGNNIDYWEIRNSWGDTGDNGYGKIALSTSTPPNMWCQIDIPLYNGQQFDGGVISFLPGDLEIKNHKDVLKSSSDNSSTNNFFYNNILYIIIVIVILVLIILIYFIYRSKYSNTNTDANINYINKNNIDTNTILQSFNNNLYP